MVDVWLLNFDADDELSRTGRRKAPVKALFAALAQRVGPLLGEGHRLLGEPAAQPPGRGRAWMMTDAARAELAAAGFAPVPSPPMKVLVETNGRRFSSALGTGLPGATFATSEDEALRAVASPSPTGTWLLVREHAFAGRHRHRLEGTALSAELRTWMQASFRSGEGIEITPWMRRTKDFGLHGYLASDGALTLGAPTEQRCDARGQWQSTVRTEDLTSDELHALTTAGTETAHALHRIGYFGPFGIDAFRYEAHAGSSFCARCEVNARYSMGWAVGMGNLRPDLA